MAYSWTKELAYVVGLITTDGNLSKDGRHLEITSVDLEQLENVRRILGLSVKIGYKSSGSSKKLYPHIQWGNIKFYPG